MLPEGNIVTRAANDPSVLTITEKAPTRTFSWLKVPNSASTFVAFIQGEHRQLSKAIETMQNPLFCVNSVYLELAILQDFAENMIES